MADRTNIEWTDATWNPVRARIYIDGEAWMKHPRHDHQRALRAALEAAEKVREERRRGIGRMKADCKNV